MKNILALSVVLYGEKYINKFFNFSFKTIIQNLNNLNKEFRIKFIISTDEKSIKKIKNKILSKINVDTEFLVIKNKGAKYHSVTQEQLHHLKLAKDQNIKYLFFLYADIIFSKYSFKNSIKYLTQNRKLKVISTFALLLNQKNIEFKKFFYYLLKKKEDHLKLLINNKNIIDKFHQSFEKNTLNFNKSFFYLIKNKNLYLKTFHYHPIVVTPNKINAINILNLKIHTLDNQFMDKIFSINEIYVEQNLKKISLFSFDSKSRFNVKKYLTFKFNNEFFEKVDDILLSLSAYEKSELENKLFMNNTISYINDVNSPISIKNDFFDKEKFLKNKNLIEKNKHYKDQGFVYFFSIIKNLDNNKKKNNFLIFCYFIFFLFVGIISINKEIFKIYLKFKDSLKFILGRKKILVKDNFNIFYALIYVRLVFIYFKSHFKVT